MRLTQLIDSVTKPPAAASPAAAPQPHEDDDGHVIDEGDYIPPLTVKPRDETE